MRIRILVEIKTERLDEDQIQIFKEVGFFLDGIYAPIRLLENAENHSPEGTTMIIRGIIEESRMKKLKSLSIVVGTWKDSTFDSIGLGL